MKHKRVVAKHTQRNPTINEPLVVLLSLCQHLRSNTARYALSIKIDKSNYCQHQGILITTYLVWMTAMCCEVKTRPSLVVSFRKQLWVVARVFEHLFRLIQLTEYQGRVKGVPLRATLRHPSNLRGGLATNAPGVRQRGEICFTEKKNRVQPIYLRGPKGEQLFAESSFTVGVKYVREQLSANCGRSFHGCWSSRNFGTS